MSRWWCVCCAALQAKRKEQALRNARSLAVRSVQAEIKVRPGAGAGAGADAGLECLLCSVKAIFRSIELGDKSLGADMTEQTGFSGTWTGLECTQIAHPGTGY